jgi:(p)ppGpp synthase/HD superfamily hydrolase
MTNRSSSRELVKRARESAANAHTRIGHRRKYMGLPYATHLENVAALVESVSDEPETIAAAWLHNAVEDTPATGESIEEAFGKSVASLVESLVPVRGRRQSSWLTSSTTARTFAGMIRVLPSCSLKRWGGC